MTDPLRFDPNSEAGPAPERDSERDPEREKDARVEGLLLGGLDHYFSGQHELAISVWTRVLFLDRGHARAKAYIDRARSAIAERQREGDELLHTGAAAFDRGDAGTARRLLRSAVERGASIEEAQAMLERLDRLEHATVHPVPSVAARPLADGATSVASPDTSGSSRAIWVATGVIAGLAAAGVVAWVAVVQPGWLPVPSTHTTPNAVTVAEPLPVPSAADVWLSRARRLYEDGRLRDALRALSAIGASDPRRTEADELKAAIQRKLLEASRLPPAGRQGAAPPK